MPRGTTPRQPARTGRQEGARKGRKEKVATAILRTARVGKSARPNTERTAANVFGDKAGCKGFGGEKERLQPYRTRASPGNSRPA